MATKSILTTPPGPATARRPAGRRALALAALAIVVLLVVGGGIAFYLQAQDAARRMGPAVQVADLPVARLTLPEAQASIEQHFARLPDTQVTIRLDEQVWTFPARDLGIRLDIAATVQAAHLVGRDSVPATVQPVLLRDRATADRALRAVAADVAVAPQDAEFSADADGVRVTTAQAGRRLDAEATWQALVAATAQYPFGTVTAKAVAVPPTVSDQDIASTLATLHRLTDAPLALTATLVDGTTGTWAIDPATLRSWLAITRNGTGPPTVQNKLDDAHVTAYLQGLATDLKREAKDAALALPNYATVTTLTPDVTGQQLDVAASLTRMQAAVQLNGAARRAELVIERIPAAIAAALLQPLKDQVDATLRDGLSLTGPDKPYQLSGALVSLALYVQPSASGAALPYELTVNDNDLSRLAAKVARDLDKAPKNAMYRVVNGQVGMARPSTDGLEVDQAQTAAAIKAALLSGAKTAAIGATVLRAEYNSTEQAGAIITPDLLQADNTFYGYSSPERNWNVTLGARKLDGWLIPPGVTFSTNEALGDLTLDAGFKMGWAILVQSGSATTIPSEAGGICQVATTLFHPVFWAGLPIVERHHHSYWISTYGKPPLGMQGLDATISPPWSDMRFKNTTGNWLMIRAKGDTQNLRVELWGTNPGWRVQVDQPVVTKMIKTDPRPRRETSDKIPAGREVQVEHAQDGFTSDIHRQVFDKNAVKIDDWHAEGTYLPAHNTFVMGTGKVTAP